MVGLWAVPVGVRGSQQGILSSQSLDPRGWSVDPSRGYYLVSHWIQSDNLKKTIAYTLTHSLPEVWPIFLNLALSFPLGEDQLMKMRDKPQRKNHPHVKWPWAPLGTSLAILLSMSILLLSY